MKNQKGAISAGLIVALGFLGLVFTVAAICVMSYISAANYGNVAENGIKAAWENNENILAQYSQKIGEAAQIPSMQTEDLVKLFTGSLGARYGANGSQASMQWIKEQNPNLDQRTYARLMQLIEAGRDEFKNAQTQLVDRKRQYQNALGFVWQGFWLKMAGYPKIDLDKYKIITNEYAGEAFKTGKEKGPMTLRPAAK